ncbi:unnamed protein product [Caretta caretta]
MLGGRGAPARGKARMRPTLTDTSGPEHWTQVTGEDRNSKTGLEDSSRIAGTTVPGGARVIMPGGAGVA